MSVIENIIFNTPIVRIIYTPSLVGLETAISIKTVTDAITIYIIRPIWANILTIFFLQFLKIAKRMTNISTYINSVKDAINIRKMPCNTHHAVERF